MCSILISWCFKNYNKLKFGRLRKVRKRWCQIYIHRQKHLCLQREWQINKHQCHLHILIRTVVIITIIIVLHQRNNNNNNRPDITFMNKKTKNTFLVDIAAPNTHNLAKTITDKQNKYQELENEICAMWRQKAAEVIPIVISSTGVIPKSLSQSITRLNLHPNTYIQLQKSVILGTCSIVRNFLNYK